MLLANHGPVVSGRSFRDAVFAAEGLEETAKLVLLTRQMSVRRLSDDLVAELNQRRKSCADVHDRVSARARKLKSPQILPKADSSVPICAISTRNSG
ncbi:class II aldolase/adducin family protein [Mesorhizobium sp. NFR06]|uniref:class II aldolase/adducin family protein n=1 Tax=Mesorhizobium sp. NFR06 TaxID=1566290 RepID=UPI001FCEAAB2|nr:class II aldolase/adducin family protein [Mesorhizobium sp. NFR06]